MGKSVILYILFAFIVVACATDSLRIDAGYFPETVNETMDVDAAIASARAEGKKTLIVLGANWCHDSTAFMKSLEAPSTSLIAENNYEVVLINVGEFERGYETAERFHQPIYTHTPTVLIVDPEDEVLVNWKDHWIWRDAAKKEPTELLTYLAGYSADGQMQPMPDIQMSPEAHLWAKNMARRIRSGYEYIRQKGGVQSEESVKPWKALQPLRYDFGEDYAAVLENMSVTGKPGDMPSYPTLPWE